MRKSLGASSSAQKTLPAQLPGLRYGVVIRPPAYGWTGERFESARLISVDDTSIGALGCETRVVVEGNFVGVVATTFEAARNAAQHLVLRWEKPASVANTQRETLLEKQNTEDAFARDYGWPSRLRWGEIPEWVIAESRDAALNVWTRTATPEALRHDLSLATSVDGTAITLHAPDGKALATGLGRHCGDDAAVDAALLAKAVGAPVAVWLSAAYEADVKALGRAQRMMLSATHQNDATISHYRYRQAYANGEVAAVGLLLSGRATLGAQTERKTLLFTPYRFEKSHLSAHTGERPAANMTLQDVQQTFAREAFVDELAHARGEDPLTLRLDHLDDDRGSELLTSVARQAGWPKKEPAEPSASDVLKGRGLAYAQLPDRHQRLESGVRSAWIADVDVNRVTGDVRLTRLVVGQDSGDEVDTAHLQQTLQERVLGESRGLLGRAPTFDEWGDGQTPETSSNALATRTTELSTSSFSKPADSSTLPLVLEDAEFAPGVAVIANALFDATGVRFREPPFTAGRVRQALDEQDPECRKGLPPGAKPPRKKATRRRWLAAAALTTVAGSAVMAWPWKGAITPITRPGANLYSVETIERGRLVAAAGDCAACHTTESGATNAGGHAFETPFGTLYSTNITPDEATGIGSWSFAAFERAMREGVGRDGRHLYPAFPYTAFAKTSDADLQALYAYLMAQPAVSAPAPKNALTFPFNVRALMAPWQALYHDPTPFQPDPTQSELYNRGAYLTEGLGHCSACHSPRNAMGAEKQGEQYLAGAVVDGWEAPALNTLSRSPVAWSESSLFDYLRHGRSELHGVASGPMAPVVAGLGELPEYDVRAIAHYVAQQMQAPAEDASSARAEAQRLTAATSAEPAGMEEGAQLFQGACAACHVDNGVPGFTKASTSLALNTNLHSDRPDNVIQSIMGGVHDTAVPGTGSMPGFADSFSDTQVATLTAYLRARFAPEAPMWQQLEQRVAETRQPH
ncbi:c-type cytochrome [Halomonas sp. PAMB 3264]|uniref:c-type cytochrome n=1 Tax=Halomonas sp. PAMB 3264 TaxID=3075222 RepID=UPI00289CE40D|nr:c-type cytochrome [Halomonas sp. PAMB 3264]WNL42631.1 c-type cytochrome [Halomonas sp. PAMB 3264]